MSRYKNYTSVTHMERTQYQRAETVLFDLREKNPALFNRIAGAVSKSYRAELSVLETVRDVLGDEAAGDILVGIGSSGAMYRPAVRDVLQNVMEICPK